MLKGLTTRRVIAALAIALTVVALAGPWLASHAPTATVGLPFAPPGPGQPLGTDYVGSDVLSRVLHGGRTVVLLAVAATLLSYLAGGTIGLAAGLFGHADTALMRPVDVLLAIPPFLVLAVLAAASGRGALVVVVAAALANVPGIARVVRAATLEISVRGYVEAAHARGESWARIAVRDVVPNITAPVLSDVGSRISGTIAMVAGANFLGLGLQPPGADWALMVAENRTGLTLQPWAVVAPALLIAILTITINLAGDELAKVLHRTPPARPHDRPAPPSADVPCGDATLEVRGLRVVTDDGRPIVDDVQLTVPAGQVLGLIGESGSGKTTTALALLGWTNPGTTITAGSITIAGTPMLGRPDEELRPLRATMISYVPQDPLQALNPARRIGRQLTDILRAHNRIREARPLIESALRRAQLPTDRRFLRRFPHQLSGGQRQRVVIAQALLLNPKVIVLDEPTTGLDTITQREFLDHLGRLRAETGTALVYVTHDVAAIAGRADRIAVLRAGVLVEQGPADEILHRPREPYTRSLLAAVPDPHRPVARTLDRAEPTPPAPVLRVRDLIARHGHMTVLHGIDLDLAAGSCHALVGTSGSGKTTLGRCIAGLHRPAGGTLTLHDTELAPTVGRRTPEHRQRIHSVAQSPSDSLNPRRTIGAELARVVRFHGTLERTTVARRVAELLDSVRLPAGIADRYPANLSGGEQQRAAIARALAGDPTVLVCDEITSALDVSVQAAILTLLTDLQRDLDLSLLFITHDLGVVAAIADHVTLIHDGRIRTSGPVHEVLHPADPHPLIQQLLHAAPTLAPRREAMSPNRGRRT